MKSSFSMICYSSPEPYRRRTNFPRSKWPGVFPDKICILFSSFYKNKEGSFPFSYRLRFPSFYTDFVRFDPSLFLALGIIVFPLPCLFPPFLRYFFFTSLFFSLCFFLPFDFVVLGVPPSFGKSFSTRSIFSFSSPQQPSR